MSHLIANIKEFFRKNAVWSSFLYLDWHDEIDTQARLELFIMNMIEKSEDYIELYTAKEPRLTPLMNKLKIDQDEWDEISSELTCKQSLELLEALNQVFLETKRGEFGHSLVHAMKRVEELTSFIAF